MPIAPEKTGAAERRAVVRHLRQSAKTERQQAYQFLEDGHEATAGKLMRAASALIEAADWIANGYHLEKD